MAESAEARAVVQAIRARFRLKPRWPAAGGAAGQPRAFPFDRPPVAREVLARSHVDHVERDGAWLRLHLPDSALRGVIHRANVSLPERADRAFHLVDIDSGVAVDVALAEASDVAAEVADGFIVYRRGHASGADIVHRVTAEGTEDYLVFEHAPDLPELRYQIALGDKVAALRLVANTLEMLDAGGAPRLRMAPPYVVDAAGERREANVAVSACEYDADPRMPWGRAVKAPGAKSCEVRITWDMEVTYPAVVDPVWEVTGSMATARASHTASMLTTGINAGRVLVAGGEGFLSSAEVYDPETGTWGATQSMSNQRWEHTASVLTTGASIGKILVAGGYGQGSAEVEVYDPALGTWSAAPSMSAMRHAHTASVLPDGKVLVAGGGPVSAEVYDPVGNTWKSAPTMADGRQWHTATRLEDGKILVAGGLGGLENNNLASAEVYDPVGNTWSSAPTMAEARAYHTATRLAIGKVLVAGGFTGSGDALASVEVYDPLTNSWDALSSMNEMRGAHTATLLDDGRVLVAGGISGSVLGSAEAFDPTTSAWSTLPSMNGPRYLHTATLLDPDKVLVAGGIYSPPLASAELFLIGTPLGDACAQMSDCISGFCADGVCCDAACDAGPCDACLTALGATMNGECSLLTGTACNDDNACTQTDTCQGGVCTGTNPVACTAPDPCHDAGMCIPASGVCFNPLKPDGSACGNGRVCISGVCVDGAGGSGGAGDGGTGTGGTDEPRTFYSCSAGNRAPADPWVGFAAVWGMLALATRARRRRG